LTRTTMKHPDFAEGVRAMVVDKDRKPKWQPARIEDVNPAMIRSMFEMPEHERAAIRAV
jgi:enoyl-CoA hydratase